MEILVLHPGALGDILLSLPALRLLRFQWPKARITLAGNMDSLSILGSPFADNKVSLSTLPLHRFYGKEPLSGEDLSLWNAYDRIVSWTGSGNPRFEASIRRICPNSIVARWRPDSHEQRHVSRIFAETIAGWFPIPSELPRAQLEPGDRERQQGKAWLAGQGIGPEAFLLAVHPGAGSSDKRWPVERFAEVVRQFPQEFDARLLLIEGPAEIGLASRLRDLLPGLQCATASGLTLPDLAGILCHSSVYIGNDSGISHLAAALGLPSILIFGPTLPAIWAPQFPSVRIVRAPGQCPACGGESDLPHGCLENISAQPVIDELEDLLRQ